MKRKNLIAWLVALALLLSGTALAAEKVRVMAPSAEKEQLTVL